MDVQTLGQFARSQTARCPTLILGVGNILLRDEGVGVHVIQALGRLDLPPDVEVVDGGTAGFALVEILADRRKVIVVDAIAADCAPGTVVRLNGDDLAAPSAPPCSLHEVGLAEALGAARQLGVAPHEVIVIGVQPCQVSCGLELSPTLAALVPRIVDLVLAELPVTNTGAAQSSAGVREYGVSRTPGSAKCHFAPAPQMEGTL
jgi:hydrogenase maturation protease